MYITQNIDVQYGYLVNVVYDFSTFFICQTYVRLYSFLIAYACFECVWTQMYLLGVHIHSKYMMNKHIFHWCTWLVSGWCELRHDWWKHLRPGSVFQVFRNNTNHNSTCWIVLVSFFQKCNIEIRDRKDPHFFQGSKKWCLSGTYFNVIFKHLYGERSSPSLLRVYIYTIIYTFCIWSLRAEATSTTNLNWVVLDFDIFF